MRFAFIDVEKACFPISVLCRVLQVSRSGYHAWRKRPESEHARRDRELGVLVRASHEASRGRYGSPRVHADLVEAGHHVSRKRVVRLMQEQELRARRPRRYRRPPTREDVLAPAPNLLQRDFTAGGRPDERWVGDTTELRIGDSGAKAFLAVILDLFSRLVVGWAISAVDDRRLTLKALDEAVRRRGHAPGLLMHVDQGSPYACEDHRTAMAAHGITCSMSRTGDCFDNAAMESFFSTFKAEEGEKFESYARAKEASFDFIEVFYNRKRRHSTLGQISPAEYERRALDGSWAA